MSFPEKRNPAYDHIDARQKADARHGTQAGDPIKGAKAMYELATLAEPPLRVVIGSDAHKVCPLDLHLCNECCNRRMLICCKAIMDKIQSYEKNYRKYEKLAYSTDVDT